jgi:hypothetical protein
MKKNLFILVLALTASMITIGCQEKRGCTDSYSDNYDPEATQDDDTCVPTRDKFVGEYYANGTIEDDPGVLIAYEQIGVNIVDSTAVGQDGLIIGISNFDVPVNALSAKVNATYNFQVIRQSLGVFTYWGSGNINGRVMEMNLTRTEEITLPDLTTTLDTIYLNLYAIKELEE